MTNVQPRPGDVEGDRAAVLRGLHVEGRTLEEIGGAFGVTGERARQLLEDLGLSNKGAGVRRVAWLTERRGAEIAQLFLRERDDARVAQRLGLRVADVRGVVDAMVPDPGVLRQRPRVQQPRFSDEDLTWLLRSAADEVGEPLSHDAYNVWARERVLTDGRQAPTHQTMALRWDSWRAALMRAGLQVGPRLGPRSALSRRAAVAAVVRCWQELGGPPTVAAYEAWSVTRADAPSAASVRKFVDGWQDARVSAWEVVHGVALERTDLPVVGQVETDPEALQEMPAETKPVEIAGQPYRPADEDVDPSQADLAAPDLGRVRRAWRAHASLQNEVADVVSSAGLAPLSPQSAPWFDVAWRSQEGTLVICEVKSADDETLEDQMRTALAQVLRYQLVAERRFSEPTQACIYIELEPDDLWLALCARLGLRMAWPPLAVTLVEG